MRPLLRVLLFLAVATAASLQLTQKTSRRAIIGFAVGAAAARPMAASATRPKPTKASREAAKEYKYAPRPIMDENYKIINADVAQGSELAAFYKEKGRGFRQDANAEKEAYRKQQQAIEAALAGRK